MVLDGITKAPLEPPFENEVKLARREEIKAALSSVPPLGPAELAEFAVKMNWAAANGLVQLTAQEHTALRTISQKCIPDAPKQINLNAKVQTEQVILQWLTVNDKLLESTNKRVKEQSAIELDSLTKLEGFKAAFNTEEEEDGE